MAAVPLEAIAETRDASEVLQTVENLIEEFREELGILHEKKDIITKQREDDLLLSSANQLWKARSAYKYSFKNELDIRTNHIESMKSRAKDAIIEAEAINQSLVANSGGTSGGGEIVGRTEEQKLLELRVTELQQIYFAVNDIFNTIGCLIDEILADFEDFIQNAAIYEQAKSKLESKLKALELEYFPIVDIPSLADSGSTISTNSNQGLEHSSSRSTRKRSGGGTNSPATNVCTTTTSHTTGDLLTVPTCTTKEIAPPQPMTYVLYSTKSQPSCLAPLSDLGVEELEMERVKIRHVLNSIFDEEAKSQLDELKLFLEEVDLSSDSVKHEIESLIGSFEKEHSAAKSRKEDIEVEMEAKVLQRSLNNSVKLPWRRSVNPENGLPIYFNNESPRGPRESSEHPKFVKIRTRLLHSSSEVKFPNYRVGKKATYFQYMMMGNLWKNWKSFIPRQTYSQMVGLPDFLPFIRDLYESIDLKLVSRGKIAEAMDCFYNLLIKLAEPDVNMIGRTGQCVVILLSGAGFQDKLTELFRLFESNETIYDALDQEPMILASDLKLLLQKLLLFVNFLDEESYELMERSLNQEISDFDTVWVTKTQFLTWANRRPFIIDWIRCHEEFLNSKPTEVKHQAKCNQCLVYPIEGILFNCQKCPNFHLCDTCYLAKAFHHSDSHDFFSMTEPLAGNKKGFFHGSLFKRRSKNKTGASVENSSATESLSLDRRNSSSTSSVKTRSKRKGDVRTTNSGIDESAASRKISDPYCTILDKEQIEKRRSVVVQNHYNSLKLPARSEIVTAVDKQEEIFTTPTVNTSIYVSTSYEYLDCSSTGAPKVNSVPKNSFGANKTNVTTSDEHMAIRQLVLSLGDRHFEEQETHSGFHANQTKEQATQGNKDSEDEKGIGEKVSELEDMFSSLFSRVKTISQTAGIALDHEQSPELSTDNKNNTNIVSNDEIQYDSVLSLKFAKETEQVVIHVTETLLQLEANHEKETKARSSVIGAFEGQQLCYPIKTSVAQTFQPQIDESRSVVAFSIGSSEPEMVVNNDDMIEVSSENNENEEHLQTVDYQENNQVNLEERKLSLISNFCSDLVEQCFKDANIFCT